MSKIVNRDEYLKLIILGLLGLVVFLSVSVSNITNFQSPDTIPSDQETSATRDVAGATAGAYYTGNYPNYLKTILAKTDAEIQAKLDGAWEHFFKSSDTNNKRIYFEQGDEAYVLDVYNDDVRTEGISWAMMIAVQMNKQSEFDKLYARLKSFQHPQGGKLAGFFPWKSDRNGNVLSNSPAPDGEIYATTALYIAANRWGNSSGRFNYDAEANQILYNMVNNEKDGNGNNMYRRDLDTKLVAFVPLGSKSDPNSAFNYTDPSYTMPAFIRL